MNAIHQVIAGASAWAGSWLPHHLWQTLLVVGLAGVSARLLQSAPARVRYLIWFLASVKLAVPVVLLVWVGEQLDFRSSPNFETNLPGVSFTDPFLYNAIEVALFPEQISRSIAQVPKTHEEWPCLLTVGWLLGTVVLTSLWVWRRRRLKRCLRGSIKLSSVREAEILARLQSRLRKGRKVELLCVPALMEPGVWGIWRPAIVLPQGLAEHLSDDELETLLLHELIHVQRWDNLASTLQMGLCCLFWFFPAVWWIDRRMLIERELACDEAVVALSQEPNFYRSGLLKALHFCLGWKMAGISAIGGSNLKRRIDHMRLIESWQTTVTSRNRAALALFLISVLASFLGAGWVHIRSASAQDTGDLSGKVFDASGAAIPGARIVLSGPEMRNKEVVFSEADGQFKFAALPAGTYLWAVSETGFRTREGKVSVNSQNQARLDVVLEIGEVFMSVGVVGRSPRLSSPPSTPGSVPRRAQVGGNVQQMNLVSQVNPSYPEHLQAQGIEGVVLLEVIVDKEGTSRAVRVANTLAHPELAESAVEAVKQWRYQPALLNGQPIEVVTEITVNFKLPPQ